MSYHIESGNVLFGTANVPAYAFVTTGGGLLQLERPDGNAALLEIDGNIQAGDVTLLTAATAGVVATDTTDALTSTAYDTTALGNASHLLTGILPSARLTGPYANTTELDIQGGGRHQSPVYPREREQSNHRLQGPRHPQPRTRHNPPVHGR